MKHLIMMTIMLLSMVTTSFGQDQASEQEKFITFIANELQISNNSVKIWLRDYRVNNTLMERPKRLLLDTVTNTYPKEPFSNANKAIFEETFLEFFGVPVTEVERKEESCEVITKLTINATWPKTTIGKEVTFTRMEDGKAKVIFKTSLFGGLVDAMKMYPKYLEELFVKLHYPKKS